MFVSQDGTRYEWRRLREDASAYDVGFQYSLNRFMVTDVRQLYLLPQTIIAKFRLEYEDTPGQLPSFRVSTFIFTNIIVSVVVGPCFAYLQFCFDHDVLLLEAMLALCVNRWIDK